MSQRSASTNKGASRVGIFFLILTVAIVPLVRAVGGFIADRADDAKPKPSFSISTRTTQSPSPLPTPSQKSRSPHATPPASGPAAPSENAVRVEATSGTFADGVTVIIEDLTLWSVVGENSIPMPAGTLDDGRAAVWAVLDLSFKNDAPEDFTTTSNRIQVIHGEEVFEVDSSASARAQTDESRGLSSVSLDHGESARGIVAVKIPEDFIDDLSSFELKVTDFFEDNELRLFID